MSIEEIKQLYEATFLPHRHNTIAIGQRDRAIIAIFYGCGLRRSEGKNLNINDIDLQKQLLFVRKAKGNKQRYVPIANKHLQDIKDYLKEGREWFLYHHDSNEMHHSKRHGTPLIKKKIGSPPSGELEGALFAGNLHNTISLLTEELKGINPQIKNALYIRASVILYWLRQYNKRQVQYMAGHKYITSTEMYEVQELETLTSQLTKHHPFS